MSFPALNHLPTKGISPRDIDYGTRLRPADPERVAVLAASMANEGLMQPIGVRANGNRAGSKPYSLIWGLQRNEGALLLEWDLIDAKIVPASAEWTPARLIELEALENLARADLSPYDRAIFIRGLLKAMRDAAGLKDGQDARAVGGFASVDSTESIIFTVSDLATRIGRSVNAVEKDLTLVKRLQPATAEVMRGRDGWGNGSVVTACAALATEEQDKLSTWLIAKPAGSLKGALASLDVGLKAVPDSQTKAILAVRSNWDRLPAAQRTLTIIDLAKDLTPKGVAALVASLIPQGDDA